MDFAGDPAVLPCSPAAMDVHASLFTRPVGNFRQFQFLMLNVVIVESPSATRVMGSAWVRTLSTPSRLYEFAEAR